jgi:putative transposase
MAKADHDAVRGDYWTIFDNIDAEPGQPAMDEVRRRADQFAQQWADRYPRAVDELSSLTAHLRFPREHWRRIRHTNLIERTFGESRRRARSSVDYPASAAAVAYLGSARPRLSRLVRVDMNPTNVRLLQRIRAELFHPDHAPSEETTDRPATVTPAA